MSRVNKPRCYFCERDPPRRARIPANSPRFCSLRCAADWSIEILDDPGAYQWNGYKWVDPNEMEN